MEEYYDEPEEFEGGDYESNIAEQQHDQEIIDSAFDGDAEAYYIWKVDH